MAFPTAVNDEITDAATQADVTVAGDAPAIALGSIYTSSAHALATLFENAVQAQQQGAVTAQAATAQGVIQIYEAARREPRVRGLG